MGPLAGPCVPALCRLGPPSPRPEQILTPCPRPGRRSAAKPSSRDVPRNTHRDAVRGAQGSRSMCRPQRQIKLLWTHAVCPLTCTYTGGGPSGVGTACRPSHSVSPAPRAPGISAEHSGPGIGSRWTRSLFSPAWLQRTPALPSAHASPGPGTRPCPRAPVLTTPSVRPRQPQAQLDADRALQDEGLCSHSAPVCPSHGQ